MVTMGEMAEAELERLIEEMETEERREHQGDDLNGANDDDVDAYLRCERDEDDDE